MAFKVLCVDHVGVAVKDLALIKQQMKDILGLDPSLPDETVEDRRQQQASSNHPRRPKLANSNSWVPQLRMARSLVSLKNLTAARTASGMLLFVLTTSKHASQICRLEFPLIDKKSHVCAGGCHIAFLASKGYRPSA